MFFTGTSFAHEVFDDLQATSAANVDVFHLGCFSWATNQDLDGNGTIDEYAGAPARLALRVRKITGNGTLRLSAGKLGVAGAGVQVNDATTGAAYSGWTSIAATTGDNFALAVTHSSAVLNTYEAQAHCERSTTPAGGAAAVGSGAHTGTDEPTVVVDQ